MPAEVSRRPHPGFLEELWRLTQLGVAFFALYSMIAHIVHVAGILSGGKAAVAGAGGIGGAARVPGIIVTLPDPWVEVTIACIVTGVLTYFALKYLCDSEWVKEPVEIKHCWEEIQWYNPWSWVKAIVCTVVETFKWVLKQICGWVRVLVTVLIVTCIILTLIVIA